MLPHPFPFLNVGRDQLQFEDEVETALAAFSNENHMAREDAIKRIVREYLIREGFLFSGQEGIHPAKLNASNDG